MRKEGWLTKTEGNSVLVVLIVMKCVKGNEIFMLYVFVFLQHHY